MTLTPSARVSRSEVEAIEDDGLVAGKERPVVFELPHVVLRELRVGRVDVDHVHVPGRERLPRHLCAQAGGPSERGGVRARRGAGGLVGGRLVAVTGVTRENHPDGRLRRRPTPFRTPSGDTPGAVSRYTAAAETFDAAGQPADAAAEALGTTWNHAQFEAHRTRINQLLASGRLREGIEGAWQLLQRARIAGEQAYLEAAYDLAMANWLLGRVLETSGAAEQALRLLDEAQERFEAVERDMPGCGAERMASVCLTERGDCLGALGRLDEAALAYEEAIRRDENRGAERDVAVGKGQLGSVRLRQRRYPEALEAHAEARERFSQLDEPGSVAIAWHQIGIVHQRAGNPEAAEDAYRKSLAIKVRLGNVAGQASTLAQLGMLYDAMGRTEEAVAFLRQAVDKYVEINDVAGEGRNRGNLAIQLRRLGRLDEARQECLRAIEYIAQFGHASEPWKTWAILADIETDAGNHTAAAEAQRKAIESYRAYRRDGGENHYPDGRLAHAVSQQLIVKAVDTRMYSVVA